MQHLPALQQQTMTSREIAELTGKRHDNVMRDTRAILVELHGEDGVLSFEDTHTNQQNGQAYPIYRLPKRETLILISGYSVQMRAKIIDRWQELEHRPAPAFQIPTSLPEALRLAADMAEKKALAEAERDEAIRTKALIGSKREATAMATASVAKREAERLAVELDLSMQYASIKRMERTNPGKKFNWRALKKASVEMGLRALDVFDSNYGTIKSYHASAWKAVYSLDITKESAHA